MKEQEARESYGNALETGWWDWLGQCFAVNKKCWISSSIPCVFARANFRSRLSANLSAVRESASLRRHLGGFGNCGSRRRCVTHRS